MRWDDMEELHWNTHIGLMYVKVCSGGDFTFGLYYVGSMSPYLNNKAFVVVFFFGLFISSWIFIVSQCFRFGSRAQESTEPSLKLTKLTGNQLFGGLPSHRYQWAHCVCVFWRYKDICFGPNMNAWSCLFAWIGIKWRTTRDGTAAATAVAWEAEKETTLIKSHIFAFIFRLLRYWIQRATPATTVGNSQRGPYTAANRMQKDY